MDLKTTSSCATFSSAIKKYGYHRQMAFYEGGLYALTKEEFTPHIVCVETDMPYSVMAAPLGRETLLQGAEEIVVLMKSLAACMFTDSWPGVESPEQWELPE